MYEALGKPRRQIGLPRRGISPSRLGRVDYPPPQLFSPFVKGGEGRGGGRDYQGEGSLLLFLIFVVVLVLVVVGGYYLL